MKLRNDKRWQLNADVFKDQWSDNLKQIVEENNEKLVPLPSNMTHIYQPFDLTMNKTGIIRLFCQLVEVKTNFSQHFHLNLKTD